MSSFISRIAGVFQTCLEHKAICSLSLMDLADRWDMAVRYDGGGGCGGRAPPSYDRGSGVSIFVGMIDGLRARYDRCGEGREMEGLVG